MKKILIIAILLTGCVNPIPCRDVAILKIAHPSGINPEEYWPNEKDIFTFYGNPVHRRNTEYGFINVYNKVQGCDELVVRFETDSEQGYERLVSSMLFRGVSPDRGELNLGGYDGSSFVKVVPLVIEGKALPGRYTGVGASIRSLDHGRSIEIQWE